MKLVYYASNEDGVWRQVRIEEVPFGTGLTGKKFEGNRVGRVLIHVSEMCGDVRDYLLRDVFECLSKDYPFAGVEIVR